MCNHAIKTVVKRNVRSNYESVGVEKYVDKKELIQMYTDDKCNFKAYIFFFN